MSWRIQKNYPPESITALLREQDTLALTPEHSGLTITSYAGGEAVISGGQALSLAWAPAVLEGARVSGVFVADVPDSAANFTQLYVDAWCTPSWPTVLVHPLLAHCPGAWCAVRMAPRGASREHVPFTIARRTSSRARGVCTQPSRMNSSVARAACGMRRVQWRGFRCPSPWRLHSTFHAGICVSLIARYVDGRREIRARWPNGDPETQGLHTPQPNGWDTDARWAMRSQAPLRQAPLRLRDRAALVWRAGVVPACCDAGVLV